jgi:RNA polymerase sigma factor FliA
MDAEERALWKRLAAAKRQATVTRLRNLLVERYLPLVTVIAERSASRLPAAIQLEDVESAGYQGLIEAVPRFDLARGYAPQTFLAWRIRGAISDWLRMQSDESRQHWRRVAEVERWEQTTLGRPATDEEVKEQFGFVLPSRSTLSLNSERSSDGADFNKSMPLSDSLADPRVVADASDMSHLLRGLSQRERLIVLCYYVEGCTMRQTGQQLGLSESRISQMMTAIVERIKRNAAA